jgi:2,4-dienoyl-CoA reductase-like NADH-dependent reductase (Old Yellow Enzyme family)
MSTQPILRLGTVKTVGGFRQHLQVLGLTIPCDDTLLRGTESPLRQPLVSGDIKIGNRIVVQPMEGWDGSPDGNPSENTIRRWQRFGRSGAKLIWGGEAVAVSHEGRANPNQLVAAAHTEEGLSRLRETLIKEHRLAIGSDDGLLIGLQLTDSGRYSRPNVHGRPEPRILYHHPFLDRRLGLPPDCPLLTDAEIETIIGNFHKAALLAWRLGFDFVDIKHCHGYLGHEFLSAHTRAGRYGGCFENRTRFLREVVHSVPFHPDPAKSSNGKLGPGIPEPHEREIPYRWGFGVNALDPTESDLDEPVRFLSLLEQLGIQLVNITAGSPYYNPHLQRPALYPPSDGYLPPEDPLVSVARQMEATRRLKQQFPNLIFVGTGYSYLQDFLPHVAQAALRDSWVDMVGMGRMVLTYPELLWDATEGRTIERKRICRTFSDCTTAPRKGLPSGCYPLDTFYKDSDLMTQLAIAKKQ